MGGKNTRGVKTQKEKLPPQRKYARGKVFRINILEDLLFQSLSLLNL
jgi:hypothetical protein